MGNGGHGFRLCQGAVSMGGGTIKRKGSRTEQWTSQDSVLLKHLARLAAPGEFVKDSAGPIGIRAGRQSGGTQVPWSLL